MVPVSPYLEMGLQFGTRRIETKKVIYMYIYMYNIISNYLFVLFIYLSVCLAIDYYIF